MLTVEAGAVASITAPLRVTVAAKLEHGCALLPLRVRGVDRVRLHADLTILTKLACV
jgi:hypothetical protein